MLTGPKGSGKTTLAERIPGLLPDLSDDESLELTAVTPCAARSPRVPRGIIRPPFRAPHHSASRTGILGGGSGRVRPGEVSKAHLGVLFLDEFPLFPTDVVEALREPLEAGEISISRGEEDATYPARAMFVFACNPCRCGEYHPYSRDPPVHVRRGEAPGVPPQDLRADRRPGRHHPVRRAGPAGAAGLGSRCRSTTASRAPPSGSGSRLPANGSASATPDHPWRLNAQAPGPMLREQLAAHRRSDAAPRRGGLRRAGSPVAVPCGSTGSPGRWPTSPGSTSPASTSSTWRCGSARPPRCSSAACPATPPTTRGRAGMTAVQ